MNNTLFRIFFVSLPQFLIIQQMKYNELEKKIKKAGCFDTGKQMA